MKSFAFFSAFSTRSHYHIPAISPNFRSKFCRVWKLQRQIFQKTVLVLRFSETSETQLHFAPKIIEIGCRSMENEFFKVCNLQLKMFTHNNQVSQRRKWEWLWFCVWTFSIASCKLWKTRSPCSDNRFRWFLEQNEATFLKFQKNTTLKQFLKNRSL